MTSSKPVVNIPNYPDQAAVLAEIDAMPHSVRLDIEEMARDNGLPKSANVVLLGMAAPFIKLLEPQQLRDAVARVFAPKGEAVVAANLKAFDLGLNHSKNQ